MTPTKDAHIVQDVNRALMTRARDMQRDFIRLISGLGGSNELLLARQKMEEATALVIKHLKK